MIRRMFYQPLLGYKKPDSREDLQQIIIKCEKIMKSLDVFAINTMDIAFVFNIFWTGALLRLLSSP